MDTYTVSVARHHSQELTSIVGQQRINVAHGTENADSRQAEPLHHSSLKRARLTPAQMRMKGVMRFQTAATCQKNTDRKSLPQ